MRLGVREFELTVSDARTRLPFRFGVVTLTGAPILVLRARVEVEGGGVSEGCAADLLVPKWFEKDPAKSIQQDVEGLMESARRATRAFAELGREPRTLFELWREVYGQLVSGPDPTGGPRLVRGFGVALAERALMDALCRAAGLSFFEALKADLFGFEPGALHAELAGWDLAAGLGQRPLDSVELRHTVGLADPLRSAEVEPELRGDDGHPLALEEDVRAYGLSCFKLKLCGEREADRERLLGIAAVFEETVDGAPRFTVDGNEQFEDLDELSALFDDLRTDPRGARLLEGLLYVEQPLPRATSLAPGAREGLARLSRIAPVILDEADHGLEAFPEAIALGYRGVSVKNCKGVFRALVNRGLCERRGGGLFQSAEDLTNLPVLALQQDLATVAALGLEHVERNGHHYFRGLDHLPRAEAEEALARHPDLYRRRGERIELAIDGGRLEIGSLQRPGYGHDVEIRTAERTALADWKFEAS